MSYWRETTGSQRRTATLHYFVWRVRPNGRRSRWYSWRLASLDQAKEMVAYWRRRDPREYALRTRWEVTQGEHGDVVASFTTKEAMSQ